MTYSESQQPNDEQEIREIIGAILDDYYSRPDEYLNPEEVDDGTLEEDENEEK